VASLRGVAENGTVATVEVVDLAWVLEEQDFHFAVGLVLWFPVVESAVVIRNSTDHSVRDFGFDCNQTITLRGV